MNDPVAAKGDGARPLAARDMKAIMRVQEACYHPSLIEPAEALLSKMLLFPLGAWGCFSGEELVAYIVCIPAEGGDVVALGRPTVSLPRCPDRLHIHDLAVLPAHRGRYIASDLVRKAHDIASWFGHRRISLVSVQGTERYWSGHGFEPIRAMEYAPGVPATYILKTLCGP